MKKGKIETFKAEVESILASSAADPAAKETMKMLMEAVSSLLSSLEA